MEQNVLEEMIEEREKSRSKLQAKVDALDLEIKVLKEALEKAGGPSLKSGGRRSTRKAGIRQERPLPPHWQETLKYIGSEGQLHLEAIDTYLTLVLGEDIKTDTQRSQLSQYVKKGWLTRAGAGVYKLTESGAEKCGYVKKNSAPEGAEDGGQTPSDQSWSQQPVVREQVGGT